MSDDVLRHLGPVGEFDLITRCLEHGQQRRLGQEVCAHASGVEVGGMPLICELGAGHAGRHVHTNGGHACWEVDDFGYAWRMVVSDFESRDYQ